MTQSTERKLTTIVSADAVGYSRLMGQDEAGTFATLKAYRELAGEKIASYRGRVVNTAGDSILAEFASVVRAVECAVDIQREIAERNGALPKDRQMWFRIGINLGDVMVDSDDLFGDGVNVAARLQAMAEPGGILISGTVFDLVRDKLAVSFDALGARSIKNISADVSVYRVVLHAKEQSGTSAPAEHSPSLSPEPAPPQGGTHLHRVYVSAAIGATLIVFLFVVNLLTSDSWWFQWPALVTLLVCTLRAIVLLSPSASNPLNAGKARLHRFYADAAIAVTVIAFLFAINLLSSDRWWFQWPTLAVLLVGALRAIFLFRKPI
jgi:adenylate cyclase